MDRFYATGNAVDFAVNMKKLGIDTAVISTTGNDEYGEIMVKTLKEQGIDLSHFKVTEGKTAVSYMDLVGLDRTYLDYVEGVMENVEFTKEDIDFAASCNLVHSAFWGNAHMHLKEIHDKGAKICFDYATEYKDPMVENTIAYVDYPFFSFEKRTEETDDFLRSMVEKGAKVAAGVVSVFGPWVD